MQRVALFGRKINDQDLSYVQSLIKDIEQNNQRLLIYSAFYQTLKDKITFSKPIKEFNTNNDLRLECDILLSLGGDGTLLDCLPLVLDTDVAILGVNIGHLGFLTSVSRPEVSNLMSEIEKGNFDIEQHSLLNINNDYALNEVTLRCAMAGHLLDISVYIDDEFLATYTADGIIIATPTGSTAYNMSAGGPIISPKSQCLCLTPICPHNLTTRPLVVADSSVIKLKVTEFDSHVLLSIDSLSYECQVPFECTIRKAKNLVKLIRMNNQSFFSAIREKLMWSKYLR